jgi:hypothetical protein
VGWTWNWLGDEKVVYRTVMMMMIMMIMITSGSVLKSTKRFRCLLFPANDVRWRDTSHAQTVHQVEIKIFLCEISCTFSLLPSRCFLWKLEQLPNTDSETLLMGCVLDCVAKTSCLSGRVYGSHRCHVDVTFICEFLVIWSEVVCSWLTVTRGPIIDVSM